VLNNTEFLTSFVVCLSNFKLLLLLLLPLLLPPPVVVYQNASRHIQII